MKIKFRIAPLSKRKSAILFIMKSVIFFFCTTVFSFSSLELISQNTKITIDVDKVATVEEVFDIIDRQTDYSFVYKPDLITKLPPVHLKKGTILVDELIQKSLSTGNFNISINKNKSIYIEKKIQKKPTTFQKDIKGKVVDGGGVPLPGVNILIVGTIKGVQTDFDGNYSIAAKKGDVLRFSYVGFKTKDVKVGDNAVINITLEEDVAALDEVVIVSFGKQKKTSIVSSITTVKPSELKIPSSNLTTALAGRVSGLIAYQRSGEPGRDDAEFFIRGITSFGAGGNSPLILIDGVELTAGDLARLNPDDISAFSILKDASATALYGARGANGAVFVTTKEGAEGPLQVSARYETSISSNTKDVELADPVTYMRLFNEAVRTRDPLEALEFPLSKIENTERGVNPILYPTVDWQEELFSKFAVNQRANISVSGGGKKARFYVSAGFSQDRGNLKVPKINNFNSNINLSRVQLRSNTNVNLTDQTKLKLAFNAAFDDYKGPINSGSEIYARSIRTSPVWFQPFYEKDESTQFVKHVLFGNRIGQSGGFYFNPYADLAKGFSESTANNIIAQVELDQNLGNITEGLSAKATVSVTRRSSFSAVRQYRPFYYQLNQNSETKETSLQVLNSDSPNGNLIGAAVGRENIDYVPGGENSAASSYLETRLNYARTFNDKHDVGGLLVFTRNHRESSTGRVDLESSLPFRNEGLSGRFTYGYDNRYFAEFNFGYNGSERFAKKNRWGFFPSAAVGWVVTNESFLEDSNFIDNLKLKASFGLVGNDQIGSARDRFYYLSRVNLNDGSRGFTTGSTFNIFNSGVSISRFANEDITWETGEKLNLGIELGLFKALDLEVDLFTETRRNIFTQKIVPSSLGLQAAINDNVGEAESKGIDASLVYNQSLSEDFWIEGRANFTFARSKVTKTEEPDYSDTPWRSAVGHPIGQRFGLIAERLFVDQEEVDNSPRQVWGEYSGGDIKYKDLNNDGVIDDLDRTAIGHPASPEVVFGFGFSMGYKNFDFSTFFQGSTQSSFFVNTVSTAPFERGNIGGAIANNQLLKVWADSHWSEENKDIYALWPRLSHGNNIIRNNKRISTWFLQDGSFIRLKSIEIGFTLPESFLNKMNLDRLRFYVSGTNLFTWSRFKLWDSELGGNGLGYPNQRVFNLGLNVSL